MFDKRERAAFALTDEIVNTCAVEDHAFAVARELFSPRQTLQLLLLIGYFRMICSLMTALDVEAEPPFGAKILIRSALVRTPERRPKDLVLLLFAPAIDELFLQAIDKIGSDLSRLRLSFIHLAQKAIP
ncbi:MAG: hypothetical protein ABSG13_25025 [Bryobacteraceae bacterium]